MGFASLNPSYEADMTRLPSLFILLLGATLAFPHSEALHTSPAANAVLQTAPREVSVLFNQKVEAAADAIAVEDASGARVDQGNTRTESDGRVIPRLAQAADCRRLHGEVAREVGRHPHGRRHLQLPRAVVSATPLVPAQALRCAHTSPRAKAQ